MANFLIVVDPEAERRTRFLRAIKPLLAPVSGLRIGECNAGAFSALWAASVAAPVSATADASGAAVVWGDAIDSEGKRGSPDSMRAAWTDVSVARPPAAFDGFHAAVVHDSSTGTVFAGADLLGLFPVYYYATNDVLLIGTSPELFRYHERFSARLNRAGLIGILLTGGAFQGVTLWANVRRLSPGHLLHWERGSAAREIPQHEIPVTDRYFSLPLNEQVELLDSTLERVLARQLGAQRESALLLSGGRDSRLLAGLLQRRHIAVRALTLGRRGDYDADCASAVARALRFSHTITELDFARAPENAARHATWEHGVGHFAGIYTWETHQHLRGSAQTVVSGHLLELIVGGVQTSWASTRDGRITDAAFLNYVQRHALAPAAVAALLPHDTQLIDEVSEHVRRVHQAYPGDVAQRAFRFLFAHWGRFHPGSAAWRISFGAWPLLPVLDRELLAIAAGLPASTLQNRGLHDALLRMRFPHLARLPLDRSTPQMTPIAPGRSWRIRESLRKALARAIADQRGERRFYYRVYDFNGPGWRAVRRIADRARGDVADLFDASALNQALPDADTRMAFPDPVIDSFGIKTLLGVLLWAGQGSPSTVSSLQAAGRGY